MHEIEFSHFNPLDYACQEAINTLCTNLTFLGESKRKIMFTSCQAHEGKSMLSMNVMRTLAHLGHSVVLVDCDLRRSQLNSRYGVKGPENMKGITNYLAGHASLNDIIYKTHYPNAYFVPVGHLVSNSLSLLATARLPVLLNQLAEAAEYVIIDAPPVGLIIDAAEISKFCDGTIIVVNYNTIDRKDLLDARQQIENAGCEVLGAVLNQVSFDSIASKKYYNKSYYYKYDHEYNKNSKSSL